MNPLASFPTSRLLRTWVLGLFQILAFLAIFAGSQQVLQAQPAINTQPASVTVAYGASATFAVSASGTPTYQWRKNGVALTGIGATSASYTARNLTSANTGDLFSVVVSDSTGSVTSSNAVLTVNPPIAPSIITQPANQTVAYGGTTTFNVVVSGTTPLNYQWRKNGVAISQTNNSSYTTPALTTGDSGSTFSVVVSNMAGSVASSDATVMVSVPVAPTITAQPANKSVTSGSTAIFSVAASGTAPFSYQWRKNGSNISGATAASYTTPVTTIADNGALFSVVVSNAAGSAPSANATLTVSSATSAVTGVTANPNPATLTTGGSQTFTAAVSGTGSYSSVVSWSLVSGVGSINPSTGVYTSGTIGSAVVKATSTQDPTKAGTASVTVNAPSTVTSVSVTPNPVTCTTGVLQLFTANVSGTGTYSSAVTWSVVSGVGTINPATGEYSASVTGTATVQATSTQDGTQFGTAVVTVTPNTGSITSVTVSPNPATLTAGGSQTFVATVTGTGGYGSTVTWSLVAGVGSINATTGVYTSSVEGTATIQATSSQDGTKTGTASVTVTAVPISITGVAPDVTTATLPSGGVRTFTAWVTGTGSFSPNLTWTATGGNLSTTTTTSGVALTWTAPTQSGTYTVKATAVGDTTKYANITVTVSLSSLTWKRDIIYMGTKEVAEIAVDGVHVTLVDHLGSPRFEVDRDGNVTEQKFAPFGESLTAPADMAQFAKGFTNHEQTDPSGFIYMQARFYAPMYHRFASPDPGLDQHFQETQSWNIYSYVMNNPIMATDPTGMFWKELGGYAIGVGKAIAKPVVGLYNHAKWAVQNPGQHVLNSITDPMGINKIAPGVIGNVKQTISNFKSASGDSVKLSQAVGELAGDLAMIAAPFAKVPGAAAAAANPVPEMMARVIAGDRAPTMLGAPGATDVFVTAAKDIQGLDASGLAQRLTIPEAPSFTVIEFPTPTSGVASPINRTNPGFVQGGKTAGGAREYVVPNQPVPPNATVRKVN